MPEITIEEQVRLARQLPEVGSHISDEAGRRWLVVSRTGATQAVTLCKLDEDGHA